MRSVVLKDEVLTLKIIALAAQPCRSVQVRHRPLGGKIWETIAAEHVARAVWKAKFPAASEDFEYQIIAESTSAPTLTWPSTAPERNQSVVVSRN